MSKLSLNSIFCAHRANAPLNRKIWHMAWPPMISNITTPLLGLVDTAVVGHLGTATHLGAVAIGAVFSASYSGRLVFADGVNRIDGSSSGPRR